MPESWASNTHTQLCPESACPLELYHPWHSRLLPVRRGLRRTFGVLPGDVDNQALPGAAAEAPTQAAHGFDERALVGAFGLEFHIASARAAAVLSTSLACALGPAPAADLLRAKAGTNLAPLQDGRAPSIERQFSHKIPTGPSAPHLGSAVHVFVTPTLPSSPGTEHALSLGPAAGRAWRGSAAPSHNDLGRSLAPSTR